MLRIKKKIIINLIIFKSDRENIYLGHRRFISVDLQGVDENLLVFRVE